MRAQPHARAEVAVLGPGWQAAHTFTQLQLESVTAELKEAQEASARAPAPPKQRLDAFCVDRTGRPHADHVRPLACRAVCGALAVHCAAPWPSACMRPIAWLVECTHSQRHEHRVQALLRTACQCLQWCSLQHEGCVAGYAGCVGVCVWDCSMTAPRASLEIRLRAAGLLS